MSWSGEHSSFIIKMFLKNDSVTMTQRVFRTCFRLHATDAIPDRKTILQWVSNERTSGSALPRKESGRPWNVRTPENVQRVTIDIFVTVNATHFTHCIDILLAQHVSTLMGHLQVLCHNVHNIVELQCLSIFYIIYSDIIPIHFVIVN
jgi:hypothetical protein